MTNQAVSYLLRHHPWMSHAEAMALIVDSFKRHSSQNKYGGMTKTLVGIDVGIFGRTSEKDIRNKLAVIQEWT